MPLLGPIQASLHDEYPPKADLRKELCRPLPLIPPGIVNSMDSEEVNREALAALRIFNNALHSNNVKELAACFFPSQALWRDTLALTCHLRTFTQPNVIATAILHTNSLRGIIGDMELEGRAILIPATPVLQFIDCRVVFKTSFPVATCSGRLLLLPTKVRENGKETITWKIWILSTWIENLDLQVEDETLLRSPGRNLDGFETIETDVLIVGGGNAGSSLAARLKALGVESIMVDKNPKVGDNWALRYDCMRFHVPTAVCEMPYLRYNDTQQTPHCLTRDELAEHLKRYVSTLNLNIFNSATIQSTVYNQVDKQWVVTFRTPSGNIKAACRQLVQATGIGSSKPNIPPIPGAELYRGISVHSAQYRNAKLLVEQGAKSVLVIGSANTAFDIIEDCYEAGLQTTMVARSPTYLLPMDYLYDSHALGAYDHMPIDIADKMFMTFPTSVDSQLTCGLFSSFSSKEPDRYKDLAAAGFAVIDSRHPHANLQHHLLERAGGHYIDMDEGVHLISEGKVSVKSGSEPVAYTATGLLFSDGKTVDTDAVVWCTGFADRNVRDTAASILGGDDITAAAVDNEENDKTDRLLGPCDVAARLDATWGLDGEGEIRGMWKRHLRMENYWIMGGFAQPQRWYSRVLAQQIKLALASALPPAYRDTPIPVE